MAGTAGVDEGAGRALGETPLVRIGRQTESPVCREFKDCGAEPNEGLCLAEAGNSNWAGKGES